MASLTSLGFHKPLALPFLVAEGILSPHSTEEEFSWQTVEGQSWSEEEEELVATDHCVVWSKGGVIQRLFRFDIEKEPVQHAIFTNFPYQNTNNVGKSGSASSHEESKTGTAQGVHGGMDVPKQRARGLNETPVGGSDFNSRTEHEFYDGASTKGNQHDLSQNGRALVVILKSQAHIFFLSGTSHIVHLPFEVDAVFPSIYGVLLQRKVPEKAIMPTPQIPFAPNNSFAFSQGASSDSPPSSQPLANLSSMNVANNPVVPLLKDLLDRSTRDPDARGPRLFCFTDPFAQIGAVATKERRNASNSHSARPIFGSLDSKEILLYVSSRNELESEACSTSGREPVSLAVTENEESGILTIWMLNHVDLGTSKAMPHGSTVSRSGTLSHRRSSFAPSMATGTITPTVKGTVSARESFGGTRSRRHVSSDPTFDEAFTQDEDDLLDSALGVDMLPIKSSRRVSGLLARSDISTSHDRTAFSDLAGIRAGNKGGRKGASFGAQSTRLSASHDTSNSLTRSHHVQGIRTSLDSVSLYEPHLDDHGDDPDDIHDYRVSKQHPTMKGLRKEIVLTKIYSMHSDGSSHRRPYAERIKSRQIVTMKAPEVSLGHASDNPTLIMCLMDRSAQELLIMQINLEYSKASNPSQTVPMDSQGTWKARITGSTRRSSVIDVCKVSDGVCSRLLVLEPSEDGYGKLSLQAAWSSPCRVELPSIIRQHNPYMITGEVITRQKGEGGFRRIVNLGRHTLAALQHSSCHARFDVLSSKGLRHRVQLQLRPRNPLVQRIIQVTESVLPSSAVDGETMLRGWWDTMLWLQTRPEAEVDIEWSAIIILLLSMGVSFVGDRHTGTTARQKKKKAGLMRSSSGATTDLDSWEAMISREAGPSGVVPGWMDTKAWEWTAEEKMLPPLSKTPRSSSSCLKSAVNAVPIPKKSSFLINCISIARDFISSSSGQSASGDNGYLPTALSRDPSVRRTALASILVSLHLLREDLKLDVLAASSLHKLTPVLAQIGTWLGWEAWGNTGFYMQEHEAMDAWLFEDSRIINLQIPAEPFLPPSIFHFIEATNFKRTPDPFLSLADVANSLEISWGVTETTKKLLLLLTPRTIAVTNLLTSHMGETSEAKVLKMIASGFGVPQLETLPESVAAPLRAAIASCQSRPSTAWNAGKLKIIGREDIAMLEHDRSSLRSHGKSLNMSSNDAVRDVHSICHAVLEVEAVGPYDGSAELDRQSITRLLFKEDQRFAEAAKLVHPLHYPVGRCTPEPEWSDTELLEAQQEVAKFIAVRTLSVSLGRGLLFYSARFPLLTEKFPIHGFTLSCVMKPAETTVTADRNLFTEDKVSWAFFHAGVEAGLSISRNAEGIEKSWILFNKPQELTNRHAGFLLALGMNGHLKSIAKWVAFKYLTPKHTMTSIGLLLGLSASYLGTMDTLITRLLSVHVTRMLPPGAAELNLSPLTQTSGIMGIGLLYCNTQHRRMSEIMLSEMENIDEDDTSNPLENLRDEGYRLSAGFALGYINLGRGKDLKGLHDMHLTERLLVLAVGTRQVDIVHILDKASAAATVALALIFMKTQDEALARKIDIPDTVNQFDNVRPDIFLLRTVARHLIMWNQIEATSRWISLQLPIAYQHRSYLKTMRILSTQDMPFFNIVAGLCLSIGLRFAGSGSLDVRNLLCHYLDQFMRICRVSTPSYDGKLARLAVRNCQDVVALAASCVMAGTGDLHIFRRLRSLHGRTDADTPYGSHLATHFAIGILFMGGGTYTFGTSSIAVASLLCAFYPLFPNTVLDNKSHLQAFRHFWVLAAEQRCIVARDVDTHRPLSLPVLLTLRDGTETAIKAPCLLPELDTVAKIQTNDPEYWSVTLDIANNVSHRAAFSRHQSIYIRRRAAYDAHTSVYSATVQALNDAQSAPQVTKQAFRWIFNLPTFAGFDRAEQALVLPAEAGSSVYKGVRGTVVDDRLSFERVCLESGRAERLWNLRILFAWADGNSRHGEKWNWLGKEAVEGLKAQLAMRRLRAKER